MDDFITDRQIMIGAEDRITALISGLQNGKPVSQDSLISILLRIQSYVHMVTSSTVDYQVVVNHLDENIAITDKNGQILYVNPAYERNIGITKEDLIGQSVYDLFKYGEISHKFCCSGSNPHKETNHEAPFLIGQRQTERRSWRSNF